MNLINNTTGNIANLTGIRYARTHNRYGYSFRYHQSIRRPSLFSTTEYVNRSKFSTINTFLSAIIPAINIGFYFLSAKGFQRQIALKQNFSIVNSNFSINYSQAIISAGNLKKPTITNKIINNNILTIFFDTSASYLYASSTDFINVLIYYPTTNTSTFYYHICTRTQSPINITVQHPQFYCYIFASSKKLNSNNVTIAYTELIKPLYGFTVTSNFNLNYTLNLITINNLSTETSPQLNYICNILSLSNISISITI